MSDTIDRIKGQIEGNNLILYMKGSPQLPQCGFSSRAVQILNSFDVDYAYVDVLANPDIRQTLPQYAQWPTFPQLYIKGELVGGCDIISELYESGELADMIKTVTDGEL
jgi:monothiol glutaredoxin